VTHPRRTALDAFDTFLDDLHSPAIKVYAEDMTAHDAPCYQYAILTDRKVDEQTTKARYCRDLDVVLAAIGSSPAERDSMCETFEAAFLGAALPGGASFEGEFSDVDLSRDEQAGERTYPAVHRITIRYFHER
jgi:hypothetical protein